MHAARVTVVVPCVCVCLFVVFCLHVHLDPEIPLVSVVWGLSVVGGIEGKQMTP